LIKVLFLGGVGIDSVGDIVSVRRVVPVEIRSRDMLGSEERVGYCGSRGD
jgi:hypothetical protein